MNANYQITLKGIELVQEFIALDDISDTFQFLEEVAAAFVEIDVNYQDDVLLRDATYNRPGKALGSLIEFSDWDDNATAQTAEYFRDFISEKMPLSSREQLHLYIKYLESLSRSAEAV